LVHCIGQHKTVYFLPGQLFLLVVAH
jgi:hypothetical protein